VDDQCEVVYVAGLGKMLGRTEASVREGIRRGVDWLPKGFKMGSRHCWLKDDVKEFLRACRDGETKRQKPGRKRQATRKLIGLS
jgi:hypothetical protein